MLRIKQDELQAGNIIEMKYMEPLEVGIVVDDIMYGGDYVMRTASYDKFEVMNISNARRCKCWCNYPTLKVRLLGEGEKLTIELYN